MLNFLAAKGVAPKTEGIKYAGSKWRLIPHILDLAHELHPSTIFDGFSGSTRVAQAFAQSGYRVIANDRAVWSETFAKCHLKNKRDTTYYSELLAHLNHLDPVDGWYTAHYGGLSLDGKSVGKDGLKKPWQTHNTQRLDAIRQEIDRLGLLDLEKAVLVTSLIYALDKVDNTIGHYAAYLTDWSPRSYKTMALTLPMLNHTRADHQIFCRDIFDTLSDVQADVAYFDPPYGSNNEKMPPSRIRYSAYYHVWKTICLNDQPKLFGKALRRTDTSDTYSPSIFEEFRRGASGHFLAIEAIDRLLLCTKAEHIILSYSSGGRATAKEISDVIGGHGRLIKIVEIDHRRNVMSSMRWTGDWVRNADQPNKEFLILLRK